ncbi:RNA recognition motif, partial [Trifolium medium]|nr:RNA recognition motif [Trifolium medium]
NMREKEERGGLGKGKGGEGSRSRPRGYVHRLDQVSTSFFFTNFPEDVKVVDLWPRFAHFGRVGEVYIPNKVDKQGHRFGFVKFRDVSDATDLLRRISNIWVDSFKLRVNLAKFRKNTTPTAKVAQRVVPVSNQSHVQADRSFRKALVEEVSEGCRSGRNTQVASDVPIPVDQSGSEVVWEVEVEDEVLNKLGGAYVGYLVVDKEAIVLQNQFRMEGFQHLQVCSLGFMKVLLWSDKVGEVKEVAETVGWWCSLFEKLVRWSPSLVSNQRVTWLRCYGVPVHAWGNDL